MGSGDRQTGFRPWGTSVPEGKRRGAERRQFPRVDPNAAGSGLCGHRSAVRQAQDFVGRQFTLPERQVAAVKGGGIHHDQVSANMPGDHPLSRLSDGGDPCLHLLVLPEGFLVHLADAAPGDDVVELVQANRPPCLPQFPVRVLVVPIQDRGHGGEEFGVVEGEFGLPVRTLVAALGGVRPAVVFQVELPVPDRQIVSDLRFHRSEEVNHGPLAHAGHGRELPQHIEVLQHLPGGPATAISMPKGQQEIMAQFLLLELSPRSDDLLRGGLGVVSAHPVGVAGSADEMCQDACAVYSLPQEGVVWESVVLVPADLRGHEV